jgi:hypothetical protein
MLTSEANILGFMLGLIVSILIISATFILNRKLSLTIFVLATATATIQFGFILDLLWLATLNFLLMLRNISFNIERFEKYRQKLIIPWMVVIYSIYIPVVASTEGFTLLTMLPLLAILLQTVGLAQTKNILLMKTLITLNEMIWLTVLSISLLWGNVVGSIFVIISGLVAIFRILYRKHKNVNSL